MLLLLSYPVARWQVLLGKFLGHLAVLAFATCLGYGAAVGALAATGSQIDRDSFWPSRPWWVPRCCSARLSSPLAIWSARFVRDRGTAAGICIGLWLLLVLIYDMALLGVLALDQGRSISAAALNAMLLANPTDAYRLINLTGFANVSTFAGMAGLAQTTSLTIPVLLTALLGWTLLPLGLAALAFSRREL